MQDKYANIGQYDLIGRLGIIDWRILARYANIGQHDLIVGLSIIDWRRVIGVGGMKSACTPIQVTQHLSRSACHYDS